MFPISLCCFDEKKTQIRLNKLLFSLVQPSDVHSPWHKGLGGGGGGVLEPLRQVFFTCCSTLKRFFLQWKAFDLLDKMRYILWVLALRELVTSPNVVAILDFTKN